MTSAGEAGPPDQPAMTAPHVQHAPRPPLYQPPPRIQPHSGVLPQGRIVVRPVACRGGPPSTSCGRGGAAPSRHGERYASAPSLDAARIVCCSSANTRASQEDLGCLQPEPASRLAVTSLHNSLDRRLFTRNPPSGRMHMYHAAKYGGSVTHIWQPSNQHQQPAKPLSATDSIYRDSPPLLTPSPSDSGFASGMENSSNSHAPGGRTATGSAASHLKYRERQTRQDTPSCCAYQSMSVRGLEQCLARAEQEVSALRSRLEEALWEQGRRKGEAALMRAQLRDTRNALSARELDLLRLRHEVRHNCNCSSNATVHCAEPCAESQRLRRELEAKCAEFESERERWQKEKEQVLRYQRCLLNQLRNKVLPDD